MNNIHYYKFKVKMFFKSLFNFKKRIRIKREKENYKKHCLLYGALWKKILNNL